ALLSSFLDLLFTGKLQELERPILFTKLSEPASTRRSIVAAVASGIGIWLEAEFSGRSPCSRFWDSTQKTTCCHSAMSMRWCTRTTFAFTNLRLNLRTQRQLRSITLPDAPRGRPLGMASRTM